MLRASHLKPWRASTNSERLDPFNGLLLTPNLDLAVDRCLITFTDGGEIQVSKSMTADEARALGLKPGLKLRLVRSEHRRYLEYHRSLFGKRESGHEDAEPDLDGVE